MKALFIVFQKKYFFYSLGMFGLGLYSTTVVQWLMFYYSPPSGSGLNVYLGPASFGAAMAAGRIVDAAIDPFIGFFSDRSRSRLGRRKPFMAAGLPLFAASFVLLWFPPEPGPSTANLIWVGVLLSVFFISLSLYAVPYLGLLPEVAAAGEDRVLVSIAQSLWFALGGAAAAAGPFLFPGAGLPGIVFVWLAIGGVCMVLSVFAVKERRGGGTGKKLPPGKFVRMILKDRAFLYWAASMLFLWCGSSVVIMLLPYFAHIAGSGIRIAAGRLAAASALSLAAFFVSYKAVIRYGKLRTISFCLVLAAILTGITAAFLTHLLTQGAETALFFLGAILLPCLAVPIIFQHAVTADVSDRHERREGQRQEAMIFASEGVAVKIGLSVAAASLGLAFTLSGGGEAAPGGMQAGAALSAFYFLTGAFFLRLCRRNYRAEKSQ